MVFKHKKEFEMIIKILVVDKEILLSKDEMEDIVKDFIENHLDRYKDVIIEPLSTLIELEYLTSPHDINYKNMVKKSIDPFA